ncbi:hypothetical protein BC832DRAFT_560834, partial [Gaertneriomyces semiglobifer]
MRAPWTFVVKGALAAAAVFDEGMLGRFCRGGAFTSLTKGTLYLWICGVRGGKASSPPPTTHHPPPKNQKQSNFGGGELENAYLGAAG